MPGQAANRYYLRDKKDSRAFTALEGRWAGRGKGGGWKRVSDGDGDAVLDWFLPLKSSAVEQNSQIPEDLPIRV